MTTAFWQNGRMKFQLGGRFAKIPTTTVCPGPTEIGCELAFHGHITLGRGVPLPLISFDSSIQGILKKNPIKRFQDFYRLFSFKLFYSV